MKVSIRQIHKNGYDISLSPSQPWLNDILSNIFSNENIDIKSTLGNVHLTNLSDNIHLSGSIEFDHHPLCARCGTELTRHERIPLQATLVPKTSLTGEEPITDEEETELTADDVDFAFYEGEEIDIAPILNDEISLALPYNYYCQNTQACEKTRQDNLISGGVKTGDPRWEALKDFKTRQ